MHIKMMSTLMSERVSDIFLAQTQQFPAISWREQVNLQRDDDEARFVLATSDSAKGVPDDG
jgi:hypothetical protein